MVRQKPILDDLEEFARWFEAEYKRHCEEDNIPENEREKVNLIEEVLEAKANEKKNNDESGIPCGSLTKERLKRINEMEKEFPFVNLVKLNGELWFDLIEFYGIDYGFP